MYIYLLFFHSIFRWGVLFSLLYAIYRGIRGWAGNKVFTAWDNTIRHVTATMAHVQLSIGYVLYFNSPLVSYFRTHFHEEVRQFDFLFFGLIHIILMTLSVVLITIGSAVSKRLDTNHRKFKVMTLWFSLALVIIFIAIPWPFSPLANRPYLRSF